MSQRVLVAGVGNIFLGDDGFGVEVARRLAKLDLPEWVAVGDYGISGMHLAYDLADGVEMAILVDAMPRGDKPGTIYVVEPSTVGAGGLPSSFDVELMSPGQHQRHIDARRPAAEGGDPGQAGDPGPAGEPGQAAAALFDGHGMQPDVVLGMLEMLGGQVGRVLIVGCEPASIDYGMGLSEPVSAAVGDAVRVVLDLIRTGGRSHVSRDTRRGDRVPARPT